MTARIASSRVPLLILAHLGVGGAFASCAGRAPVVEAEVIPIASVTPSSAATDGPFVMGHEPGPVGSTLQPISSSSTGQPAPAPSGVASYFRPRPNPRPFPSGSFGVGIRPPPPRTPSPAARPTATLHVVPGRPLVVEGVSHVAPHAAEAARGDVAEILRAAHDEHASIAAFARTICELMALGAPLDLVNETAGALADEIRHAEMTLARLAPEHAGGFAPLPAAALPLQRDVADLFRDVLRGGAVGETMAAADAEARADAAIEPEVRAYHATIARDEACHAALAYKTLRWLLEVHPELAPIVTEERARLSPEERLLTDPVFRVILAA